MELLEVEKPFQAIDRRAFLSLSWEKKEVIVSSENADKISGEIEIEGKGEELKIKLKTS